MRESFPHASAHDLPAPLAVRNAPALAPVDRREMGGGLDNLALGVPGAISLREAPSSGGRRAIPFGCRS